MITVKGLRRFTDSGLVPAPCAVEIGIPVSSSNLHHSAFIFELHIRTICYTNERNNNDECFSNAWRWSPHTTPVRSNTKGTIIPIRQERCKTTRRACPVLLHPNRQSAISVTESDFPWYSHKAILLTCKSQSRILTKKEVRLSNLVKREYYSPTFTLKEY